MEMDKVVKNKEGFKQIHFYVIKSNGIDII